MPCRILIVDDDEFVLEALEIDLTQAGYEVLRATNGRTALQQCYACQPHLILLDIMLPAIDGWALCRRLRNTTPIPIIIMTALGRQEDISQGFESGADDYLVKPVSFNILMAKIKALLRRTYLRKKADALPSSTLAHHGLVIELETHEVSLDGNRIRLSPTEYKRLVCLMQHRHRTVSTQCLLTSVWGPEYMGETHHVRLYIRYLRKKIEPDPTRPTFIQTVWGIGYYLG